LIHFYKRSSSVVTTTEVEYPGAGRMCYPGAVQRAAAAHHHANLDVNTCRKSWNPINLVKTINKSIINNGLHISRKIVKVTGKAKIRAVTVKRWVFDLNFSKLIIPLCLLAFLTLLHPHTEIQVGAIAIFSLLFLAFLWVTSSLQSSCSPSSDSVTSPVIPASTSLALILYSWLPLALVSRGWGWLAACQFPAPLQVTINSVFAHATGCNVDESKLPLEAYPSLSHFFTRRLRPGVRPVDPVSNLTSPADGTITHQAPLTSQYTHNVKGLSYSLDTFLGDTTSLCDILRADTDLADQGHQHDLADIGHQCDAVHSHLLLNAHANTQLYETTIYLGPGDYHRFHSPADWSVVMRRHMPGTLYSVSPKIVSLMPSCLVTNERVAWFGRWKYGTFIMIAVAATNVGDIQTEFDEDLSTNIANDNEATEKIYDKPLQFNKGDDFGHFNFGSTIVLLYEAPRNMEFEGKPVRRVKMGEKL